MTASVVIDASVAVKWFLREDGSDLAIRILGARNVLHAPDLLRIEVASAVCKRAVQGLVNRRVWDFAQPHLEASIAHWHTTGPLLPGALEMACNAAHPIYDFIYLALARQIGVPLVTADRRFLAKVPPGEAIALEDWRP